MRGCLSSRDVGIRAGEVAWTEKCRRQSDSEPREKSGRSRRRADVNCEPKYTLVSVRRPKTSRNPRENGVGSAHIGVALLVQPRETSARSLDIVGGDVPDWLGLEASDERPVRVAVIEQETLSPLTTLARPPRMTGEACRAQTTLKSMSSSRIEGDDESESAPSSASSPRRVGVAGRRGDVDATWRGTVAL